jgi:hypothetical protein
MPERIWAYACCRVTACAVSCPSCGGTGEFAGWGLTVPEAMERYRRAYGLEPLGPHLELAERELASLRSVCDRCNGAGVIGDVYAFRECPACEGGGGAWAAPEERIRDAYNRVVWRFPGARTGTPPHAGTAVFPDVRRAPPPAPRDRPPRGYSIHGLKLEHVRAAFLEAERRLGTGWRVKWRGHCRRATLRPSYTRAVRLVVRSGAIVTPAGCGSPRRLYPLPIIEEAARILRVTPWILIGKEY